MIGERRSRDRNKEGSRYSVMEDEKRGRHNKKAAEVDPTQQA